MKYLKSKKKTAIFNRKGEEIDSVEVCLYVRMEGRDLETGNLYIHHHYTEEYSNGEVNRIEAQPKVVDKETANAMAVMVLPSIPPNIPNEDKRNLMILIAAKQFFAESYADIDVSDIEIVEQIVEVEPTSEEQNGEG